MNTKPNFRRLSWLQQNKRRSARTCMLLLLVLALPVVVQAQFTYIITNGTVTITAYNGPGGVITIPSTIAGLPVTSIGSHAFDPGSYWNHFATPLTNVTVPNTVVSISDGAFAFSWCLRTFTVPNSVTSLGEWMLQGCVSLTNVTVPDSVVSIGLGAFCGCHSLTSITVPIAITDIWYATFYDCPGLDGVYFRGNAPILHDGSVFGYNNHVIVYYVAGAIGWGTTWGGRPTALWIVNRPPVAGTPFIKVIGDEVSEVPAQRFLLWCSDPDSDPLSLTAVTSPSAAGALITLETNGVSYAPPVGFLGDDTFGYTISDGNGGFASGTVSILVEPRRLAAATMLPPITSPGALQLNFTGFANLGYTVERAESLNGPWTAIGDVLTDDNGVASFTDRNPPAGNAFYRAVH